FFCVFFVCVLCVGFFVCGVFMCFYVCVFFELMNIVNSILFLPEGWSFTSIIAFSHYA
ncbi:hypothetical protein L9F63_024618, partial [Diploptera punctata]